MFTKTVIERPTTVKIDSFKCQYCDTTRQHESDIISHWACNHVPFLSHKKLEIRWLESEEEFNTWNRYRHHRVLDSKFTKSGWYVETKTEEWDHNEYSGGCARYYNHKLVHIDEYSTKLMENAADMIGLAKSLSILATQPRSEGNK